MASSLALTFFFSVTKLDVVLTSDLAGGGRKHRGTRRLREDVERRQKGTEIDTANMGTKHVQRYRKCAPVVTLW